jgi:hypothetical protein
MELSLTCLLCRFCAAACRALATRRLCGRGDDQAGSDDVCWHVHLDLAQALRSLIASAVCIRAA